MDEEDYDVKPFLLVPEEEATKNEAGQFSYPNSSFGIFPKTFRKTRTKINDELRKEIVKFYVQNPNMNQGEIADMFGIDRTTVSKLLKRKHEYLDTEDETKLETTKRPKHGVVYQFYKQFNSSSTNKMPRRSNTCRAGLDMSYKFDEELRKEIVQFHVQNPTMNQVDIADLYGIDRTTVSKLLKRKHEYLDNDDEVNLEVGKRNKHEHKQIEQNIVGYGSGQNKSPGTRALSADKHAHISVPKLTHAALQKKRLNKSSFPQTLKTPKLAYRGLPDGDVLQHCATNRIPSSGFRHKAPSSNGLKWVTEGIKVKEDPDVIEIDEYNTDSDSLYGSANQGIDVQNSDMENEETLIKKYFNLRNDIALKDEHLMKCFMIGKSAGDSFLSTCGLQKKETRRTQQRHVAVSETVTSDVALDPSMSLKAATQPHGTSQLSSHRIPKEKPKERALSSGSSDQTSNSQDAKGKETLNDFSAKEEISDATELDDTEALNRDIKSLEKFREQQKAIEEANKQKKALLSKTLVERRKKAKAEAHKLEHIQKELAKLDHLLTADVQVIRDKIEGASRDFLEAQKRFQKAEAEYVEAKMDLHDKSELKEQLTEHLYTIIHQNEVRKAKKLAELMKELEMDSTEEEYHLPELPPLSAFHPIPVCPLSSGKSHVSPVTENGPISPKTDNLSGNLGDNRINSDKISEEKTSEAETGSKTDDQKSTSENAEKGSKTDDQRSPSGEASESSTQKTSSESSDKESQNIQAEEQADTEHSKKEGCENEIPDQAKTATTDVEVNNAQNSETESQSSTKEIPVGIKVGEVSQYVRDRKAQVTEELEKVQNLIKETENIPVTDGLHSEEKKTPTSWDFSGEVNSIGTTSKS